MDKVSFEIVCSDELLAQIEEHCFSQTRTEVGGFLVGEMVDGKSVVTHVLKAKHTAAQMTQLTFTHKTWDAAFAEMAKIKPDAELIGWYHSHPNFGVFLSDHDKFIQTQFFSTDGRITIVVDPIRGKRGWFISKDKEVVPYAKEEDTTLERLGESSSEAEENIPAIAASQSSGGIGLGRVLAISGIFSLLSMFGGFTLANSTNNGADQIANLERQLNYVLVVLQENGLGVPTVDPQPTEPAAPAEPTVAPTKAATSPKPSAKTSSSPKAEAPKTPAKPQNVKQTLICYKDGVAPKRVIAINPKCPDGYTKTNPGKAQPGPEAPKNPTTSPTPSPKDPAPSSSPTAAPAPGNEGSDGSPKP